MSLTTASGIEGIASREDLSRLEACLDSPRPRLTLAEAEAAIRADWEIEGEVQPIPSTQDQNFRVRGENGGGAIFKVANRCWSRQELELQNAAMRHLEAKRTGLLVQVPIASRGGADVVECRGHLVRLLSWVPGAPLSARPDPGRPVWETLGEVAARTATALADLAAPALGRALQWDPRQAPALVALLGERVGAERGPLVDGAIEPVARLLRDGAELPMQPIHLDVTDVNVVTGIGTGDGDRISGLLDFGDVVRTWRVAEPAHAAHSAICSEPDDALGVALAALVGFHGELPLAEAECEAFWPIVQARAAVCALLSDSEADWRALERVAVVPASLAAEAARSVCGFGPSRDAAALLAAIERAEPTPIVALAAEPRVVDLSASSDAFGFGGWRNSAGLAQAVEGEGAALGRWLECRLNRSGEPGPLPPRTLSLGADLFVPAGTKVRSPLPGRVERAEGDSLLLSIEAPPERAHLRLTGVSPAVSPGLRVEPGQEVATVRAGEPSRLHVQLSFAGDVPGFGDPEYLRIWRALCPDPSALLGLDVAAPPPPSAPASKARRLRSVGRVQALYYEQPPIIARGWRHHLYDATARPYLDLVNNVAIAGHSHPAIAAAATRQLHLLNTNSRFLYEAMTEYAERLSVLLPPELDSVLLVNSGSEAVELALQLARAHTGRRGVAALEGAYHGWSGAALELCTNPIDRPEWQRELADWVCVAPQPNPYRGEFGDDGPRYAKALERRIAAAGSGANAVGAFIAEPLLGNQGGVVPARGFLAAAYEAARQHGALCIADEVQVSYGRTGSDFWAFEHEGVIPDIVCVAKAAGNGYPLGAVICRREISERFAERSSFFSTPAGSPLSCAVGVAVLDALEAEGLQDNALRVGAELHGLLEELASRHPLIGAVHGRGLYGGVELVRDRETKEPAPEEALLVCEQLRRLGVIDQPTGDAYSVLKVKPPLTFDRAAGAHFAAALDRALSHVEAL